LQLSLPDFTKMTWQLNVALVGAIFSVFALIYDTDYINYGFLTFLFGVLGHYLDLLCALLFNEKPWRIKLFFILQGGLIIAWVLGVTLLN
jgi:hypothetical protein